MGENAPPPLPRWAGKILCCFASTPAFSSSNNVLVVLHGHWNEMGEGEGEEEGEGKEAYFPPSYVAQRHLYLPGTDEQDRREMMAFAEL